MGTIIEGMTIKEIKNGNLLVRFHVEDLVDALQSIEKAPDGTVTCVANKREHVSERGHTHYKPAVSTYKKDKTNGDKV
jgi:hypothetical protein